ncbi:MAG TPA: DUF222 domain-containing protein [Acidimicrobiia bacterium]|nr:DUF222 domain-containing protein [Acidimicrobiia bacterium]
MFATGTYSWIEQIEQMPPGEELWQALSTIDRERLDGYELVVLMKAGARQIAHLQAQFYADLWAMAEAAKPFPGEGIYEFASEEIQAALSCSRRAADRHMTLAYHLTDRFPQVAKALSEGRIDLSKARVITDRLSLVDHELADRLAEVVLDKAPDQTTGQLIARIDRLIVAADPDAARKKYERSVEDRHVVLEQDSEGTATLTGYSLPADRALRAIDHIEQLARSLRVSGETRTMDQLRADVLLDLLEGRYFDSSVGRGVVDLRIDLTTLAALNDQPAEVAGWGPVLADVARQMVDDQTRAEWRVTVTNPDTGDPVWTGTTRRRPTASQRRVVAAYSPTCVFKGCRMPATRSDVDHNRPWSHGGPTITSNLAPLCPRHHTVKDRGGWKLEQIKPGFYRWTSPLGHVYLVRPQPP